MLTFVAIFMAKLKYMIKIRFSSVLVVIMTVLTLTSCEDKVTYTSSLFCDFVSTTDRHGYFESSNRYTFKDLTNIGHSRDVTDVEFLGTTITFEGVSYGDLMQGDVLKDIYLEVDGLYSFLYARNIAVLRDDERISYTTRNDPEFEDFMWDVINQYRRNGEVYITVSGWIMNNNSGVRNARIRVTLDNMLDVTVWE